MDSNASSSNSRRDEFTPDKNPKSKQTKSTRKRKRQHSSSDDEDSDTSIDAKLKQSAKRNNLTPQNVKNILQKVVKNDHVLAIVRIKGEELEKREMAIKDSNALLVNEAIASTSSASQNRDNDDGDDEEEEDDDDDDDDFEVHSLPKLTRAKAKALNKLPLPVAPIKHSEPDSEVVKLIREELHSDDDDEEYQPGEDDLESDDDINTTTSDIDSQPATPLSQASDIYDEPSRPTYSKDGLFKVPRVRNDSSTSQTEQDYIIAQRTRSKISLTETPIEAIESTFKAPDAPLDMYRFDPDDPYWTDFLTGLAMPMTSEMEKDEDADPDYSPALMDRQPNDREEFQHGNVPKKEVHDLWNEIMESCVNSDLSEYPDFGALADDWNLGKLVGINADDLNATLETPVKQADESVAAPETNENRSSPAKMVTTVALSSPATANANMSYFDPNAMSTPARVNQTPEQQQKQSESFDSFNSTLLAPAAQPPSPQFANSSSSLPNPQFIYQYPTTSTYSFESNPPIFIPVMTFTSNSNMFNQYSPQLSSNLVKMTSEATTTSAIPSTVITSFQTNENSIETEGVNQKTQSKGETRTPRPGHRAKRARFKNAAYKELENLDPNAVQPKTFYPVDERGFTPEQRQILDTQLRKHVQLATQSYVQTYGHPVLYTEAHRMKRFLTELKDLVHKNRAKSIHNLQPALDLIAHWEGELSQNTKENTELVKYLEYEISKYRKNMSYVMRFHERILNLICHSKVFMYPELLPHVPFRFKVIKSSEYLPAEDFLIAFLLEHFFDELQQKMQEYKLSKPRKVDLATVCRHISAHLGYIRESKPIYDYVRMRKKQEFTNPIKFYFDHKRAPPIQHHYEHFDPSEVIEPVKQPLAVLPTQWAKHVEKLVELSGNHEYTPKHNKQQGSSSTSGIRNKVGDSTSKLNHSWKIVNATEKLDVPCIDLMKTPIQVKILYETNSDKPNTNTKYPQRKLDYTSSAHHKCNITENCTTDDSLIKGQTLLTSFFRPIEEKSTKNSIDDGDDAKHIDVNNARNDDDDDEYDNPLEIDCAPTNELIASDCEQTDQNCLLLHRKRIRRKYQRISTVRQRVVDVLVQLARTIRKRFTANWHRFRNQNVLFVYKCVISYHRFTREFVKQSKLRETTTLNQHKIKMTTESITITRRVQKLVNDHTTGKEISDDIAVVTTATTPSHNDGGAKRLPKSQRSSDNSRLLLLTENVHESSEKDFVFAQRFLDRVEETFFNENKHHKFFELIQILRDFSELQEQSGAQLYMTLEKFFLPDYPELAETFLNFLTPSDAVAINKSMEHFFEVNYMKFLNKLNIFFHKQPAQIRKVLACLKELSDEPDLTIERIRTRILPLLKGNQLLIEWFLQCIVPDKCESSKDEYETLVLRKGNESFDDDSFECIPNGEICADPNDNPCHIRYLNGRLFYGNRFPLPAKLSFGAVPCSIMSHDSIEADRRHLIGGASKPFSYHCVHNIKEFADSKMRDRHHLELEPAASIPEVENNSDEEPQQHQHCAASAAIKVEEKNGLQEDSETPSASPPVNSIGGGSGAAAAAAATTASEQTLCDNTLLRAHSIRLNPALHSPLVHMNAELLNRLKPPDQNASETNKELRMSPKKQAAAKCTTNAQAKTAQCRKLNSPNAKKVSTTGSKSPNTKKTTSPLSSNAENLENNRTVQLNQESNAIQTAKKLKRILEINETPTPSTSHPANDLDDASKRATATNSCGRTKSQKAHMLSRPIKKQKRAHDYHGSGDEDENADGHGKKCETILQNETDNQKEQQQQQNQLQQQKDNPQPEIQWTREEDRLLLEQIKAGFDSNSASIAEFAHRFPAKTEENIRDRIDFLIDFLTKLRNKN